MRAPGFASLCVLMTMVAPSAARAQESDRRIVSGIVRDSARTPIPFALIQASVNAKVVSDDSGHFSFKAARNATLLVEVRRIGFGPRKLELSQGADTVLDVVLTPLAQQLSAIEVMADQSRALEMRGFYRRMGDKEKGVLNGEFITPEDIEQRMPPRITFMVDGIQGVRVIRRSPYQLAWELLGPGGCNMTVYLDGMRLNRLNSTSNTMKEYLDELVTPNTVAGIEVYGKGNRAPAQFQSLAGGCGVIVIWTK